MVKLDVVDRRPVRRPILSDRPTVGVIESISTGFDAVARHPWLLIVPFALDLFLWLGPRIQASALYDQFVPYLQNFPVALDVDTRLAVQQFMQALQEFFSKFNLFSWLSSGLFGVPTLNAGGDSTAKLVTGGVPAVWQISDVGSYILLIIALNIVGLLAAALLWVMLIDVMRKEVLNLRNMLKRSFSLWVRLLTFVLALLAVFIVLALGLSVVTALIGAISLSFAAFIPLVVLSLGAWGLFYLAFTLHGLALYNLPAVRSMRLSMLMTRLFFAPTLGLVVISIAIYMGIGLIWTNFAIDSWARLIAMLGNAFIVAGLMMSSLIYYQNRSSIVLDFLQSVKPTEN